MQTVERILFFAWLGLLAFVILAVIVGECIRNPGIRAGFAYLRDGIVGRIRNLAARRPRAQPVLVAIYGALTLAVLIPTAIFQNLREMTARELLATTCKLLLAVIVIISGYTRMYGVLLNIWAFLAAVLIAINRKQARERRWADVDYDEKNEPDFGPPGALETVITHVLHSERVPLRALASVLLVTLLVSTLLASGILLIAQYTEYYNVPTEEVISGRLRLIVLNLCASSAMFGIISLGGHTYPQPAGPDAVLGNLDSTMFLVACVFYGVLAFALFSLSFLVGTGGPYQVLNEFRHWPRIDAETIPPPIRKWF